MGWAGWLLAAGLKAGVGPGDQGGLFAQHHHRPTRVGTVRLSSGWGVQVGRSKRELAKGPVASPRASLAVDTLKCFVLSGPGQGLGRIVVTLHKPRRMWFPGLRLREWWAQLPLATLVTCLTPSPSSLPCAVPAAQRPRLLCRLGCPLVLHRICGPV